MARKESICRNCFHFYVCEQFNENKDDNNKKCHFFNDHYTPRADVVPKSEVDRLNAVMKDMDEQRAYTINMLGENLENAKAEVERLQAENEKLTIKMNAYGLTAKRLKEDVDRLQEINNNQVENIRLAKQEVAREIFEEIDKALYHLETPVGKYLVINSSRLAELKKNYTEEKT